MGLAEKMLSSLKFEESYLEATENIEEEHIVVNEARQIIVPNALKNIAVLRDKDIEKVTFDCIRYWDGHDLSTYALFINYSLPNGTDGTYVPENVTIDEADESVLHFDWLIEEYMTMTAGKITFSITAEKRSSSNPDYVEKRWSSFKNSDFTVVDGFKATNAPDSVIPTAATATQMNVFLAHGEVGGIYKYTGATGVYEKDSLYLLEEVE